MNVFLTHAHKALLTTKNLPEPSAWKSLDAATLDVLRADVRARLAFWEMPKSNTWKWLLGMLVALVIGMSTVFVIEQRSAESYPAQTTEAWAGLAFFVCIFACLALLMFGHIAFKAISGTFGHQLYWLNIYLGALQDDGYRDGCAEALNLVKAHKKCEAYRDAVIACGRELTYGDLHIMEELSRDERRASRVAHSRAQCQELHGLNPVGAA